jgi:hypothetical protein
MVYPIAVQQGLEKLSAAEITIEGDKVQLVYGYPAADSANAWSHLIEATFAAPFSTPLILPIGIFTTLLARYLGFAL